MSLHEGKQQRCLRQGEEATSPAGEAAATSLQQGRKRWRGWTEPLYCPVQTHSCAGGGWDFVRVSERLGLRGDSVREAEDSWEAGVSIVQQPVVVCYYRLKTCQE